MSNPISTGANSPDTLPQVGYSTDALCAYIQRQLGQGVFAVEITKQQILDCIQDALQMLGMWRPIQRYGAVQMQPGTYRYLEGKDLGHGVVKCWFVNPTQTPADLYWLTSLVTPAPILNGRLDMYATFLTWYKTWGRVVSVFPDWLYDVAEKVLYIYNASPVFHCGVLVYDYPRNTTQLDSFGSMWVKNYAYQKARLQYAEILGKYSGVIPGPVKDLQLDQGKRDKAEAAVEKLETELKAAQLFSPLMQDN